MKTSKSAKPPGWAQRLLYWYCRPGLVEDLDGDLHEYFYRNLKEKGAARARLIYIADVFKFFRPYTVRKPEFINLLIHWIMIGSYIKTSGRAIVRNKLFSTINIIGLAVSMSAGLLMIAFLADLLAYDDFHANGSRIYRVTTEHQSAGRGNGEFASTSLKAGTLIRESVSGVEETTILRSSFEGNVRINNRAIPLEGLYADDNFFSVFSFPLLSGDARTALKEPYSIVLTERAALKTFGTSDVLGKSIHFYAMYDTSHYLVTGVMKDVPKFSHLQFEGLVSYSTFEAIYKERSWFMSWDYIWSDYVYLVLARDSEPGNVQSQLDAMCARENKLLKNTTITLGLQPLNKIALGPDLSNQIGPTMAEAIIYIVGGLSFIVILSACFNYTNLSVARSIRRSKEVGIRKVIGANKGHVVGQFLVESVIISMMALIIAAGLFLVVRPHFLSLAPELSNMVSLQLSPGVVVAFILFAIIIGLLAGIFPAVFFARVNALRVIKNIGGIRVFRHVNVRKALIVVQYTFSLMFITATIIGYKQYKHALSFDLGFSTANILNINLQGNKPEQFEKALSEMPEVEGFSRSAMITSVGSFWGGQVKYKDPTDSAIVFYNMVNENYMPLHGHQLIAGRNFTAKSSDGKQDEIIANEVFLKRFNIGLPADAIGVVVKVDGKDAEIVGVMKDFHYGKIDNEIPPVFFRYGGGGSQHLNVRIKSSDWPATMSRLENEWKKIDPLQPIRARFYDDQIAEAYQEYSAMVKIIGFLAFLVITIASMGLLGMVVFTTETRLKEISIRKALGASEQSLIYILSRGFLFLLAVAACVALPLTYLFFEKVILADVVYHAPVTAFELIAGVLIVMAMAFVMIGSQTLKAARTNPSDVLKNE